MIVYLRSFSKRQGYGFETRLFKILKTVWLEGVLCLWRLNKKNSQLLCVEIKAFVLKCPKIAKLLQSPEGGLRQTEEIVLLVNALDLWYNIEHHLKRAQVKKRRSRGVSIGFGEV